MPRTDLTNRTVLVVGAGTRPSDDPDAPAGNGRAVAVAAARLGATVVCADVSEPAAEVTADLVRAEGGTAHVVVGDVADEAACTAMVAAAVDVAAAVAATGRPVGAAAGRGEDGGRASAGSGSEAGSRGEDGGRASAGSGSEAGSRGEDGRGHGSEAGSRGGTEGGDGEGRGGEDDGDGDEGRVVLGLVVNVGIGRGRPTGLSGTTADDWDAAFAVNLRAHFLLAQAALPQMAGGSSVVFIGSVAGLRAGSRLPAYDASKAGLVGLNRHVALEGARRGVRSNLVAPGLIDTPLGRLATAGRPSRGRTNVPLGRQGTAWEVADVVTFLLSNAASYVTGQTLAVDGGLSLI